jgi:hypothetical protein
MVNKYVTYREPLNGELQYFILQKQWPHFVGLLVDNPNYKTLFLTPIPHTTLYLAFFGTLQGRIFPASSSTEEISIIFTDMAQWYYTFRIENNQKRYKKWLLKSNQEQTM